MSQTDVLVIALSIGVGILAWLIMIVEKGKRQ